jgi:hypothetical protein
MTLPIISVYTYDKTTYVFIAEIPMCADPKHPTKYAEVPNTTRIKPPFHNTLTHEAVYSLQDDSWTIREIFKDVILYSIIDGQAILITYYPPENSKIPTLSPLEYNPKQYVEEIPQYQEQGDTCSYDQNKKKWYYHSLCNKSLEDLRAKMVEKLRDECNKKIRTLNGVELTEIRWLEKSQNAQDVIAQNNANGENNQTEEVLKNAKGLVSRKNNLREQYGLIKTHIKSMTLHELQEYEIEFYEPNLQN